MSNKIYTWILLLGVFSLTAGLHAQDTPLPYFEGFEDPDTYSEWKFVQPTSANKWHIGNGTSAKGDNALYISADKGKTPGYINATCGVAAYKEITLPAGNYEISFDYRVIGEADSKGTGVDSLYVYWVTSPIEQITETKGDLPKWLDIYKKPIVNDDALNGPELWHHTSFTANMRRGGTIKLVFYWINNATNIVPPGACIDNVQIASTDAACPAPANLIATHENGAKLIWDDSADKYQLHYRNNSTGKEGVVDDIQGSPYNVMGLDKGIYTFWLRGICGTDTSAWAGVTNHVIAVSTDKCINFIDITNETFVQATYGRYGEGATANKGVMDYGYASERSQHTVHYKQNEYDPVVPQLRTIPEGELASVRIGSCAHDGGAEALTYTFTVDAANPILVLKYAAVLLNLGHTGKDFKQPRFMVRITGSNGVPLDVVCLQVNYLAGDAGLPPGWNQIGPTGMCIQWKDWTSMGFNLRDYIGRQVKVYIETGGCVAPGDESCYGYGYFTMDCVSDKLQGLTCGAASEKIDTVWAPAGFRYGWAKQANPTKILTTDRYFVPVPGDTATYVCHIDFQDPGKETCSFDLTAALLPRYPVADAGYNVCRRSVSFIDSSYVFTQNGKSEDDRCDVYWDFGDGTSSTDPNPVHEYAEAGTYTVTLQASINEGECDSIWQQTITVTNDTIRHLDTAYVCVNEFYKFGTRWLSEPGFYADTLLNDLGCDSISELCLLSGTTYKDTTVCGGDIFVFEGESYDLPSGTHEIPYKGITGMHGCDSILRLTVADEIAVEADPVCGDDTEVLFRLVNGLADTVVVAMGNDEFEDVRVPVENGTFTLPLSGDTPAGTYTGTFTFLNEACGEDVRKVSFTVLYSSGLIVQRWNDVLAVRKDDRYDFTGATFRWYADGKMVDGQNGPSLYLPLDFDTEYTVEVTTAGGVTLGSCGMVPERVDDETVVLKQNAYRPTEQAEVESTACVQARVYDVYGRVRGEHRLPEGNTRMELPEEKGVYIIEFTLPDGKQTVEKVVVK